MNWQKYKQIAAATVLTLLVFISLLGLDAARLRAELPSDAHIGPQAVFQVSTSSTEAGQPVHFDARQSRDARGSTRGLSYRWDFKSSFAWTAWSSSPEIDYAYTRKGFWQARLQVRDSDGYIDETTIGIHIKEPDNRIQLPYGKFDVVPMQGDIDTLFTFTAHPNSRLHSPEYLLEVRWDWNRDGTWDTDWSTTRTFTHQFTTTGSKEVWMEMRDPKTGSTAVERGYYMTGEERDGTRTHKIGRIRVEKTERPRAAFRLWPNEGSQPAVFRFDARQSIRSSYFRWDFNGDGSWDSTWMTHPMVKYAYPHTGTYIARLEVKNAAGETDSVEQQVEVIERPFIAPEAYFTVRNTTNTADAQIGAVLDSFSFNASGSRDPDGTSNKLRIRWDYEGDGRWDTTYTITKTSAHAYTAAGDYTPRVEVQDDYGNLASYEQRIRITKNTSPLAALAIRPLIGTNETEFYFDANKSSDGQNSSSKLEARFDFDSDGHFDTVWRSNKTARHRYSETGMYTATVEVRDTATTIARTTMQLEVVDPPPPIAVFSVMPSTGTFATNFSFDARATHDPSGIGGPLLYRWDFSSQGKHDFTFDTGWQSSSQVTHRYRTVGQHNVHLAVKNSQDEISDYFQTIVVHADSAYTDYLRSRGFIRTEAPDQLVTRAALAELLTRTARVQPPTDRIQYFTDIDIKESIAPFARVAAERAWMPARDDLSFDPDAAVTRGEALQAVISALYPRVSVYVGQPDFTDLTRGDGLKRFAHIALLEGLVIDRADRRLFPSQKITQGEMARIITILLQKYGQPHGQAASAFQPTAAMASLLDSLFPAN